MKKYIIEKQMTNSTDGYIAVVVEGETHINRTCIKSSCQYFTTLGGYSYSSPLELAEKNAKAIASGLNAMERKEAERGKNPPALVTLILTPARLELVKLAVDIATNEALNTTKQVRMLGINDVNNPALKTYKDFSDFGAELSENSLGV